MTENEKAYLFSLLANTGISLTRLKTQYSKVADISKNQEAVNLFKSATQSLQNLEDFIENA